MNKRKRSNKPDWVKRLMCFVGKHERKYWSAELCKREHALGASVWRPFTCAHCGYQSQVFPELTPVAKNVLIDRLGAIRTDKDA